MRRTRRTRFAIRTVVTAWLALGLLLAPGCDRHDGEAGRRSAAAPPPAPAATATPAAAQTPAVELRSYTVPNGRVDEIRSLLQSVIARGDEPIGRVSVSPDGRLVVVAPPSIHDGIAELLANVESQGPAAPAPTLDFTLWVVAAKPTKTARHTASLNEIAPALEAITEAQGAMEFRPLEQLQVRALQGEHAEVEGRKVSLGVDASVVGDSVVARLRVHDPVGRLDTRLRMKPGTLVVLGQSGYQPRTPDDPFAPASSLEPPPPSGLSRFYVLRANVQQ